MTLSLEDTSLEGLTLCQMRLLLKKLRWQRLIEEHESCLEVLSRQLD